MWFRTALVAGLTPLLCLAHDPSVQQSVTCTSSIAANAGESCSSFSSKWALDVRKFVALNPGVACPGNLVGGRKYCVVGKPSTDESAKSTPTPSKTQPRTSSSSPGLTTPPPKPTSTQSGNGVATPSPFKSGMTGKCNQFYEVRRGDYCQYILEKYDIPMWTFYAWNPAVGSECFSLDVGYNVCVGVIGRPSTPTNGISTPWAVQTGIATNCNKFHKVKEHDQCWSIAREYGIPLVKVHKWNPAVQPGCWNLIVDYYVCVGRIGFDPATITANGGVATPEPHQPGMVGNCNRFYHVRSGDTCNSIAAKEKVSVEKIERWNRQVGSQCDNLWLDNYICLGVK